MKTVGYDTIQLVTISLPSAYGEYEPYYSLETEQKFEEAVKIGDALVILKDNY